GTRSTKLNPQRNTSPELYAPHLPARCRLEDFLCLKSGIVPHQIIPLLSRTRCGVAVGRYVEEANRMCEFCYASADRRRWALDRRSAWTLSASLCWGKRAAPNRTNAARSKRPNPRGGAGAPESFAEARRRFKPRKT